MMTCWVPSGRSEISAGIVCCHDNAVRNKCFEGSGPEGQGQRFTLLSIDTKLYNLWKRSRRAQDRNEFVGEGGAYAIVPWHSLGALWRGLWMINSASASHGIDSFVYKRQRRMFLAAVGCWMWGASMALLLCSSLETRTWLSWILQLLSVMIHRQCSMDCLIGLTQW
jgi:hypothetical protein